MPVSLAAEYLTPAEAAAVLGVQPWSLAQMERGGRLTAGRTPGGRRRYDAASVRALAAERDAVARGELLTYAGVAAAFRVSASTTSRWAKAGVITRAAGTPVRPLFRAADIRALLASGGDAGHG